MVEDINIKDIYIAIGSNIDPQDNITHSLLLFKEHVTIVDISNFYKTPPIDRSQQPHYFNGVVKVRTALSPRHLKFDFLRKIEGKLGRERLSDKYAPRTIDLDLILYGAMVIDEPDLRLPDPSIRLYPFMAIPLLEITPDLIMPDTRTPLADEPSAKLPADMQLLPDFTASLRKLIFVG